MNKYFPFRLTRFAAMTFFAFCSLGFPAVAVARDLSTGDDLQLSLNGWAQAGQREVAAPGGRSVQESYIGMARLAASAHYTGKGSAFVQLEGSSGDARLLDAVAELQLAHFAPKQHWVIRTGQFRVPTSAELQIAGPFTPFVNRALLVSRGFVPARRTGTETELTTQLGGAALRLRAGWFNPTAAQKAALPNGEGNVLSLRGLVQWNAGIQLHLAYADLLLANNTAEDSPDISLRPVLYDRQIDVGLTYRGAGWTAYLEGVLVADGPESETPYALYATLLRALPAGESLTIEPGLRYERIQPAGGPSEQRFTAGLNWYWVSNFLEATLNYELLEAGSLWGHAGYAQLQVGF